MTKPNQWGKAKTGGLHLPNRWRLECDGLILRRVTFLPADLKVRPWCWCRSSLIDVLFLQYVGWIRFMEGWRHLFLDERWKVTFYPQPRSQRSRPESRCRTQLTFAFQRGQSGNELKIERREKGPNLSFQSHVTLKKERRVYFVKKGCFISSACAFHYI